MISLNVYCILTDADNTAINNMQFYSLLSIDKMKENNQHNEMTKIHNMMLNLYTIISLSNITNAFMITLQSNIKTLATL